MATQRGSGTTEGRGPAHDRMGWMMRKALFNPGTIREAGQ